jgi:D-alanyl-D-alanine carboxypeptidase/D-alanyl-D-alanine-endopeptidase (penicillin-binding protein 4)
MRAARQQTKRRSAISAAITLAVLALLGGVAYADAHELIAFPALLTLDAPHVQPSPFPSPSGALPAPPIAAVSATLPSNAPMPTQATVQALVDELVDQSALGSHVGVLIVDQLTGEVLGRANEDSAFTPASTQKIMTGLAAFNELNPEARLATVVRQDGERLILVGGGDMLLAAEHGNPDQIDDHVGMADLAALAAAQVKLAGRTAVTLEVDDTLFEDPRFAMAVPVSEINMGFVAPVASLAVNQARVNLADKSDMTARQTVPALAAARIFAEALAEYGVTVEGQITHSQGPTISVPEIARVESATIAEVTEWAMQRSDNTLTEVLGRLIALETGFPPTAIGAVQAVEQSVGSLGVNLAGAKLVDLSGLGRGSLLTPEHLIQMLQLAASGPNSELRQVAIGLPIAGMTGTLTDRFPGSTYAIGAVRAKTGSLPGVTALAGTIVTASDRLLLFVIVADQTPGQGQFAARQVMDRFVDQIAGL